MRSLKSSAHAMKTVPVEPRGAAGEEISEIELLEEESADRTAVRRTRSSLDEIDEPAPTFAEVDFPPVGKLPESPPAARDLIAGLNPVRWPRQAAQKLALLKLSSKLKPPM